jgi:thiol:disulfide interchange protein
MVADDSSRSLEEITSAAAHIETVDTFDHLLEEESVVLVDFYADWCGPVS